VLGESRGEVAEFSGRQEGTATNCTGVDYTDRPTWYYTVTL